MEECQSFCFGSRREIQFSHFHWHGPVLSRDGDNLRLFDFKADRFCRIDAGLEHAQIVLCALIGPSAFSVFGDVVANRPIRDGREIQKSVFHRRRFHFGRECIAAVPDPDAESFILSGTFSELPVILQKDRVSLRVERESVSILQAQFRFADLIEMAENHFFVLFRKMKFLCAFRICENDFSGIVRRNAQTQIAEIRFDVRGNFIFAFELKGVLANRGQGDESFSCGIRIEVVLTDEDPVTLFADIGFFPAGGLPFSEHICVGDFDSVPGDAAVCFRFDSLRKFSSGKRKQESYKKGGR